MATKEEMKAEAIRRLQELDIYKPYIAGFKTKAQKVCFFERFGGYWVWQEPEIESKMKEIEEKCGCMVYAITHEMFDFGECWSFIFVSDEEDEWEYEFEHSGGNNFNVSAKVWNMADDFVESGSVGVKSFGGGLKRVW